MSAALSALRRSPGLDANQETIVGSTEIRRAQYEDADAIAQVLLAAFIEYKPLYTVQGYAATTPGPEEIRNRIKDGPIWLAIGECEVLGTTSAILKGDSLYLRGMAVLPTARGQGMGDLLLKRAEDYALGHHCKRLVLSTTPFLSRAIRLYERFGFLKTDEGPHDLFGTPLFTMAKSLESITASTMQPGTE
jgi:GNAT superfamily N-acetyltransferase